MAELTEAQLYDLGNRGDVRAVEKKIAELEEELKALRKKIDKHLKVEKKGKK